MSKLVEELREWLVWDGGPTQYFRPWQAILADLEQAEEAQGRWEHLKAELRFNGDRKRMPFLVAETYAAILQRMAQLEQEEQDATTKTP